MQPQVYIKFFKCNTNALVFTLCISYNQVRMKDTFNPDRSYTKVIQDDPDSRIKKGRYRR